MLSKLQHALSDQIQLLHENIISHQIDDGPEGDVEDIKIVIRKFMQLMLDISLNENSIHYLLHSHVVLDHTYEIFEDLILNFVWTFIKSTWENVYNKHMINELLDILKYYTGIMKEFGPMRYKKKLEKTKTVIVSKFWRWILKNRLKVFKKYFLYKKDDTKKKFIDLLRKNYAKNKDKIGSFFKKHTIYTEYALRIFSQDPELKNLESENKIKFWMSFLDVPKVFNKSKKKSTISDESEIYITVNEDAFNILNNIKDSDKEWDKFNTNKNLVRIKNRVLNRELSLTEPRLRRYEAYIDKICKNEFFKMGEISESNEENEEEPEEENSREIEQSYDKWDDIISEAKSEKIEESQEDLKEELVTNITPSNDKSVEYPERRSFFQMFKKDTGSVSKSYDNDTSFGDKNTGATVNSPSNFSSPFDSTEAKNFLGIPR